jgi:hypothetical protein
VTSPVSRAVRKDTQFQTPEQLGATLTAPSALDRFRVSSSITSKDLDIVLHTACSALLYAVALYTFILFKFVASLRVYLPIVWRNAPSTTPHTSPTGINI